MWSAGITRCANVWLVLFAKLSLSQNLCSCMMLVCASFSIVTTWNGLPCLCEPLPARCLFTTIPCAQLGDIQTRSGRTTAEDRCRNHEDRCRIYHAHKLLCLMSITGSLHKTVKSSLYGEYSRVGGEMRSEIARDLGMTSVMGMRFCSLRSMLEWQNTVRTASALTPRAISGELCWLHGTSLQKTGPLRSIDLVDNH
jgi:hypothetical protein